MAYINIGGQRVRVDDAFLQMSPAEQQAMVEEIARSLPQAAAPEKGQVSGKNVPYNFARGLTEAAAQGTTLGFGDELAALFGAGANTVAKGLGAIGLPVDSSPLGFGEAYTDIRDAARRGLDQFSRENPATALGAEMAGGLVTGGGGMARAGAAKGAQGLLRAGELAAAQGGAYGLGKAEGEGTEEATTGALLGALLGVGLPGIGLGLKAGARKLMKPDKEHAKAVETLLSADIPLTTSQVSGSRMMQDVGEGTLRKIPFVGAPLAKVASEQREKFQGKVLKMAGFAEKDVKRGLVDDEAILRAEREFSKRYADLLGDKTLDLTEDVFIDDLARVSEKHSQLLPFQQRKEIDDIVGQVLDKATEGPMSGKAYQSLRSDLSKKAWTARNSRPEQAALYRDLANSLDDAFGRAVPGGSQKIRTDYGRFKQVKDTYLASNSVEAAEGLLLPSGLSRRSKKKGLKDREWRELISSAHRVLGDKLPDSTTAQRSLITGLLGGSAGTAGYFNPATLPITAGLLLGGRMGAGALARGAGSNLLLNPLAARQYGLLANPLAQPVIQQ